jgi:hypothetical protein
VNYGKEAVRSQQKRPIFLRSAVRTELLHGRRPQKCRLLNESRQALPAKAKMLGVDIAVTCP